MSPAYKPPLLKNATMQHVMTSAKKCHYATCHDQWNGCKYSNILSFTSHFNVFQYEDGTQSNWTPYLALSVLSLPIPINSTSKDISL